MEKKLFIDYVPNLDKNEKLKNLKIASKLIIKAGTRYALTSRAFSMCCVPSFSKVLKNDLVIPVNGNLFSSFLHYKGRLYLRHASYDKKNDKTPYVFYYIIDIKAKSTKIELDFTNNILTPRLKICPKLEYKFTKDIDSFKKNSVFKITKISNKDSIEIVCENNTYITNKKYILDNSMVVKSNRKPFYIIKTKYGYLSYNMFLNSYKKDSDLCYEKYIFSYFWKNIISFKSASDALKSYTGDTFGKVDMRFNSSYVNDLYHSIEICELPTKISIVEIDPITKEIFSEENFDINLDEISFRKNITENYNVIFSKLYSTLEIENKKVFCYQLIYKNNKYRYSRNRKSIIDDVENYIKCDPNMFTRRIFNRYCDIIALGDKKEYTKFNFYISYNDEFCNEEIKKNNIIDCIDQKTKNKNYNIEYNSNIKFNLEKVLTLCQK